MCEDNYTSIRKDLVLWNILDQLQNKNNEKPPIHITQKELQLFGILLINHAYLERLEAFFDKWIETKQMNLVLVSIFLRLVKDLYVFLYIFEKSIQPNTISSLLKIMLFLLSNSKLFDDEETKEIITKELFTVVDEMICTSVELMNITKMVRKQKSWCCLTGW